MKSNALLRTYWGAATFLLAAAVLVRLFFVLTTPLSHLGNVVDFIYDDGYYYLTIAANLAAHGRSSFDGITTTNGYQPAWLLALAALAKVVGTGRYRFFAASCTLIYAIACATPLLALLWCKSASRTVALCVAAGLAIVMIQQPMVFLQGLEPILFPAVALPMVVLIEKASLDAKQQLKLSALLALAFLVRLDALAVYGTASLFLPLFGATSGSRGFRGRLRGILETTLRLSIFVVPTVLAYFAINHWLFGTAVPASGRAKDIGGPILSNWGIWLSYAEQWKPIAFLAAILAALELLTRRLGRRPQPLLYRSIVIVSSAVVIQYFYYAAFSTWMLWPWYLYLLAIDVALLVGRIVYLSSLFELRQRECLIGIAAAGLVGLWAARSSVDFAFDSLPPQMQFRLAFAERLGFKPSQVPGTLTQEQVNLETLDQFFRSRSHILIAMGDRSGGLAYWGRGKVSVIQTEGLALGGGYVKARENGDAAKYLEKFPIQYYLVDREVIPTVQGANGQRIFVIADPIQGRVSRAAVPTFCFPASAIRYQTTYPSWAGVSTRIAFQFSERVPCGAQVLAGMRAIETGIGLRQFSLPSEYHGAGVSPLIVRLEDRDRHWHGGDPLPAGFGRYVAGREVSP